MALNTSGSDGLAKIALIASDQAYLYERTDAGRALNLVEGISPLAPLNDTPAYDNPQPPYSYTDSGFTVGKIVDDATSPEPTGFKAIIFENRNSRELIVAFAGTDGSNPVDWWSNIMTLGWGQWEANRTSVFSQIQDLVDADLDGIAENIHFTGQSLGGALAQYAAYDFVRTRRQQAASAGSTYDSSKVTLTTFNSLGGFSGLRDRDGYDPTVLAGLGSVRHYVVENDIVHLLGGGLVGGPVKKLLVFDGRPKSDGRTLLDNGGPFAYGFVDAHRIESGFYKTLDQLNVDFGNTADASPRYLQIDQLQRNTARFGNPRQARSVSSPEAAIDIVAGLLPGAVATTIAGDGRQLNSLIKTLVDSLYNSGDIPDRKVALALRNTRWDWGAGLLGLLGVATVGVGAIVATYVGSMLLGRLATALGRSGAQVNNELRLQFDASSRNESIPDQPLEQVFAQGDILLLRGDESSAFSKLSVDPEGLAENLSIGSEWLSSSLDYIKSAASASDLSGAEKVKTLIADVTREIRQVVRANFEDATMIAQADQELRDFVTSVAFDVANANPDLTRKYSVANASVFGMDSLGRAEYSEIAKTLDASVADPLYADIRSILANARETIATAGQRPIIQAAATSDPFNLPNFDPDVAPIAVATLVEGGSKSFHLYLPYAVGSAGQDIRLSFAGDHADAIRVVVGDDIVAPVNGSVTLTLSAGEREKSFALIANGDVDTDEMVAVSATLIDAAANLTHAEHSEAAITLRARNEAAAELTFAGGGESDVFVQQEDGYVGRTVSISAGDGADLIGGTAGEDDLDGGAGRDVIIGVGGEDIITGGDGNDLIAISGEGAARIDAGAGNDVVDGLRFIDGHVLPLDGASFFGFKGVAPDFLPHLQISAQGDPRGDRAEDGVDGLPYRISLDTSATGISSNVGISNGRIALTPGGGATYTLAPGDNDNWIVTYTAGGQSLAFDVKLGLVSPALNHAGVSIDGGDGDDLLIGSLGDDLVQGGTGDDLIAAHDGDDVLLGQDGTDVVFAGDGSDFLDGGAGDDTLYGESGNDALYGGDGADHLEGDGADTTAAGQGDDYLNGEGGDDQLIGQGGADVLIGGEGSDALFGGDGNDELVGGTGNDLLQGGDGDDVLDAGDGNDVLFGEGGNDHLIGGEGDDLFAGGDGDDVLEGGSGADGLAGGAGNDILFGDEGTDVIAGGDGDDILLAGIGDDVLDGGDGNDRLEGGDGVDALTGGGGNDVLVGGTGDDVIGGGDGDDRVEGDTGNDTLRGGTGRDTYVFNRGDGADAIDDPDTGADASLVVLGDGITPDDVQFAPGSLLVHLGEGDSLHFIGFDANNPASGPAFAELRFSGGETITWNDFVQAGFQLPGSDGSDFILGTGFKDDISSFGGDDTVNALEGDDNVDAGNGDDSVFAGGGDDVVRGAGGNDSIYGEAGNDRLDGGAGDDRLEGGDGSDTYVLSRGDGVDVVIEASPGNVLEFQTTGTSLAPSDITVTATHAGDVLNVILDYGATPGSDVVTLQDGFNTMDAIAFRDGEDPVSTTVTIEQLIATAKKPQIDLTGTAEADQLEGGFADDRLDGDAGNDVLYGLWGDDQLAGGIGDDRVYGERGSDLLVGETGNDILDGGDGDDILIGGAGINILRGGPGSDEYVLDDGAIQIIADDATTGVETIRLPTGLSMFHLGIFRLADDLALTSSDGEGLAVVKAFFASQASKTWALAGDLEAPRDLRTLVAETPSAGSDDFASRRAAFDVALRADLNLRGGSGESLGTLPDYRNSLGSEFLDYQFSGVSSDTIAATGGTVLLPLSEQGSSETRSEPHTVTVQLPLYTTVLLPGESWDVPPPPNSSGLVVPAGTTVSQNPDGSLHIQERDVNRSVQTGMATVTRSYSAFSTSADRSFTVHDVIGTDDSDRFDLVTDRDESGDSVAGVKAFRGTIDAGGGDDVIFAPIVSRDDYGDNAFNPLPKGRGALIDGGGGNDVIGGTNGADDILLGAGDDLIDGGESGDTYYVPMSGGGDDLIYDSAHPSVVSLMYGGEPPEDVLAFASGVAVEDVHYRVTDGRTAPATPDFHPLDSVSNSALRTLTIDWGTDTQVRIVDARNPDDRSSGAFGIGIERYRFADGTTLSRQEFLARATRIDTAPIEAAPGEEVLSGTSGDDTFVIQAGGGVHRISPSGGFDALEFGEGIDPWAVSLGTGSLLLRLPDGGEVHVEGFDPDNAQQAAAISRYVFADGTEFTHAELLARGFDLTGTAADDTIHGTSVQDRIRGGPGDDELLGGAGDDVYFFDRGDAADRIVDTSGFDILSLGDTIAVDDVTVQAGTNSFRLRTGSGDSVALSRDAIEWVQFADGEIWDTRALEARAVPNSVPSVAEDSATLVEDAVLEAAGNAFDNDVDADGDRLRVAQPGTFAGAYGVLTLSADGSYRYVVDDVLPSVQSLADGQVVSDVFGYEVTDGIDESSAALRVSIVGRNDEPVAAADTVAAAEDTAIRVTGNVLANDSDRDALDVLSVTPGNFAGVYGQLALAADGTFTYSLANETAAVQSLGANARLADVFQYSASDGMAIVAGTLTVNVAGTDDAPVLVAPLANQTAQAGSPFTLLVPAATFTDVDGGDVLSYSARQADGTSLPAWLAFDAATRTFSGIPTATDAGTWQLRLLATDSAGLATDATFSIVVAATNTDRMFDFQRDGAWPHGTRRVNAFTGDATSIAGLNRTNAIYGGGPGTDTLKGTMGGDALLLDDGASLRLLSIEMIRMGAGDDVVDLTSKRYSYGDVTVKGGAGADVLWTNAGNDVLDGGRGDDDLAGGAGNDVYVHRKAGGDDVVTETGGQDTIRFGAGIAPRDVAVGRHGNDLVLSARTNGSVTVNDWFRDAAHRVERVQFADGTVWSEAELSMRANAKGHDHDGETSGGDAGRPGSGNGGGSRDRDERAKDASHSSASEKPVEDAGTVIAALLAKQPAYDFSAVADYLSKHYDDSTGRPLSVAEISRQWATLQRFTDSLAHVDPYAAEAAQGHGFAEDLLRVAAAALGWGYDGSTGSARTQAGMKALEGLSEGFQRLG